MREELDLGRWTKTKAKHVEQVAERRMKWGQHNNNFILTPAGAEALEAVIQEVVVRLKTQGGAKALVEDPVATAAVTGPVAVKRGLWNFIQKRYPDLDANQAMDALNRALSHSLPVDWITPESSAQEH